MGAQSSYIRRGGLKGGGNSPRGASTVVAAAPFASSPSKPNRRVHQDEEEGSLGPTLNGERWAYSSARKGAAESPLRKQAAFSGFDASREADSLSLDVSSRGGGGRETVKRQQPSTPSTATPGSLSRSASDGFGLGFAPAASRPASAYSTRPLTSDLAERSKGAGGSSSSTADPAAAVAADDAAARDAEGNTEDAAEATARLCEARQRANNSLEALQMNLKGFGGAVAVRYMSWPEGCFVQLTCDSDDSSPSQPDSATPSRLFARFERYDSATNCCHVRLEDGSSRAMPAHRVVRVSRNRATGGRSKRRTIDASGAETDSVGSRSTGCSDVSRPTLRSSQSQRQQPLPLVWEGPGDPGAAPPGSTQVEHVVPIKAYSSANAEPERKFHRPPPEPRTIGKATLDADMLV